MSYLLEILGRGLLCELAAAFRQRLADDEKYTAAEIREDIERNPDDADALKRWGARCLANGNFVRARDTYRTCVDLAPDDVTARAGLACALDELGDIEGCIRQLQTGAIPREER